MHTFTDTQDRKWTVNLTVSSIRRVRNLAGVDLIDSTSEGGGISAMIADPIALSEVLYAVCKPIADEKGVTEDNFFESLYGDCIEDATAALLGALVDFTPNPKDRANLRAAISRTNQALESGRIRIAAIVESGEIEQGIEQELNRLLGDGSKSSSSPGISV